MQKYPASRDAAPSPALLSTPELNSAVWDRAAARLLAKMLGEFAYEEVVRPVPRSVGGDTYTLVLDDGGSLSFTARRGSTAAGASPPTRSGRRAARRRRPTPPQGRATRQEPGRRAGTRSRTVCPSVIRCCSSPVPAVSSIWTVPPSAIWCASSPPRSPPTPASTTAHSAPPSWPTSATPSSKVTRRATPGSSPTRGGSASPQPTRPATPPRPAHRSPCPGSRSPPGSPHTGA